MFKVEEMLTRKLMEELGKLEESPWKDYGHGKPVTMRQLANLLKPYGVHSRDIHLNGEHAKGYRLADFQKAFKCYLPPPPPF